ncbi:hypothetical protein BMR06_03490, partial [Methylococcaceae bacterium HT5]
FTINNYWETSVVLHGDIPHPDKAEKELLDEYDVTTHNSTRMTAVALRYAFTRQLWQVLATTA